MQFLVKNKSLKGLWYLWMLLGLVLMGGAIACRAPETEAQEVDVAESNSNCSETVLTGRVVRKPWTKTAESWMAGGGDYYVLDVGDGEVEERSAEEGVILRESDRVTFEGFEEYIDRLVKVRGEYE
ncbi:MAG: hypothetical protein F6K35_41075, partial [Okeania sp. SIO2H7]|nr:hypothetical protein [Okeania sp. SIO2H7]